MFWERVIGNTLLDAYGRLIMWDIISDQFTGLARLQEKNSDQITPHKTLPPEYVKALLTFRHMLDQTAKNPIALLRTGFIVSLPIRPRTARRPQVEGSTMIVVKSKPSINMDRMMWLFETLWTSEHQLFLLELPNPVDEIEHLIQSDPKEKT